MVKHRRAVEKQMLHTTLAAKKLNEWQITEVRDINEQAAKVEFFRL